MITDAPTAGEASANTSARQRKFWVSWLDYLLTEVPSSCVRVLRVFITKGSPDCSFDSTSTT